jgi:hypothetical protein
VVGYRTIATGREICGMYHSSASPHLFNGSKSRVHLTPGRRPVYTGLG